MESMPRLGSTALVLIAGLSLGPADAAEWSAPVALYQGPLRVLSLSADKRNVDLAFVRCRRSKPCQCRHARSGDDGATWPSTERCSEPKGAQFQMIPGVEVATSRDTVHVVGLAYSNITREGSFIHYGRSPDGGLTWANGVDFERGLGPMAGFGDPVIDASGETVHLAWRQWDPENLKNELRYTHSSDGGRSWSPLQSIADLTGRVSQVVGQYYAIATKGRWVHLVWIREHSSGWIHVFHRRSTDGGLTWGKTQRLTRESLDSIGVQVAVDGRAVHVVLIDMADIPGVLATAWQTRRLRYIRSSNRGKKWKRPQTLLESGGRDTPGPIEHRLAASKGVVHVTGLEWRGLFHVTSNNAGRSWSPPDFPVTDPYDYNALAVSKTGAQMTFRRQPRGLVSPKVLHQRQLPP